MTDWELLQGYATQRSERTFELLVNRYLDLEGITGMSHSKQVEVKPGETSSIVLGGAGRTLIGRIRTVPENAVQDWTIDLQKLVRQPALVAPRPDAFPNMSAFHEALWNYTMNEATYYPSFKPDGSFVADDVPPGNYKLDVHITQPRSGPHDEERFMGIGTPIGSLIVSVTIPDAPVAPIHEPFDLGTFSVELTVGGIPKR